MRVELERRCHLGVRVKMIGEELILLLASKVKKKGIYVQKCKLIKNCKRLGYHGRSCSLFSFCLPLLPLSLSLPPSS